MSACTVVGNIIAGVLVIVSSITIKLILTPGSSIVYVYDCYTWHPSAILAWALITGLMNFFVICIGILSFCFGCYSLHVCPRFLDCMCTIYIVLFLLIERHHYYAIYMTMHLLYTYSDLVKFCCQILLSLKDACFPMHALTTYHKCIIWD